MQRARSRLSAAVVIAGLLVALAVAAQPTLAVDSTPPQVSDPNCTPNVIPAGQANPSSMQPEPLAPIWCFDLAPMPTTRVTGANDWVDLFNTHQQMGRLNDGDMDYRIFDSFHSRTNNHTQHFINNNHWMGDTAGGTDDGSTLRPNRAFTFEDGKLVVEADVAAGMSDYMAPEGGVWPEITVSTAPQPTGDIVDSLYAYGGFGGYWTAGCRLHTIGNPICSVLSSTHDVADNPRNCNAAAPSRVMEISDNEICGATHLGGYRGGENATYWRMCDRNQMDMYCRDRFRLELTRDSLTLYVNGHLYFQEGGWDAPHQLPESMVNGGQVYVYFSDWRARPGAPVYRFHWGRVAVNPHDPDGTLSAPSTAPFFCLGMPQNTCPLDSLMKPPSAVAPDMPDMPSAPDDAAPVQDQP